MENFLFKNLDNIELKRLLERLKKQLFDFRIKYTNSQDYIGDRIHFNHALDFHINNQQYLELQIKFGFQIYYFAHQNKFKHYLFL